MGYKTKWSMIVGARVRTLSSATSAPGTPTIPSDLGRHTGDRDHRHRHRRPPRDHPDHHGAPLPAGIPEYHRSDWRHWINSTAQERHDPRPIAIRNRIRRFRYYEHSTINLTT